MEQRFGIRRPEVTWKASPQHRCQAAPLQEPHGVRPYMPKGRAISGDYLRSIAGERVPQSVNFLQQTPVGTKIPGTMVDAVQCNGVSPSGDFPDQFSPPVFFRSQNEEGGASLIIVQEIQERRCHLRVRTIVVSQVQPAIGCVSPKNGSPQNLPADFPGMFPGHHIAFRRCNPAAGNPADPPSKDAALRSPRPAR